MTKINSGILGPFSGSISSYTGYRRQGSNIITARPNNLNRNLNAKQISRNSMIKHFAVIMSLMNATWVTRGIKNAGALLKLNDRLRLHYYPYYHGKKRGPSYNGYFMGIKQSLLNGAHHAYRKSDQHLTLSWHNTNVGPFWVAAPQCMIWIINVDKMLISQSIVPRNITQSSFLTTIAPSWVGDCICVNVGWVDPNVANPSRVACLPLYWFVA